MADSTAERTPYPPERFWPKVDRSGGPDACWPWTGYQGWLGYGRVQIGTTRYYTHRLAWELSGHDLDPTLQVDHRCGNPPCCNPAHLEQVTNFEERFWTKVDKSGSCWIWKGGNIGRGGYGRYRWGRKGPTEIVHRAAWRLSGRELQPGMHLDHLCRNRICVNPDHLEQVTPRENVLRAVRYRKESRKVAA